MPRVSAWLVRAALAYLVAGVTLGAWLLVQKGGWAVAGPLPALLGAVLPVHRELLLVGWLVQLAVGVGFWVLPPVRGDAVRRRPAWVVGGFLNAGVLLYVAGCLALPDADAAAGLLRLSGRAMELMAVLGFGVPLSVRAFR